MRRFLSVSALAVGLALVPGEAPAVWTLTDRIWFAPAPGSLDESGLSLAPGAMEAALRVDRDEWRQALDELREFYEQFGPRMPAQIWNAHADTARRLGL